MKKIGIFTLLVLLLAACRLDDAEYVVIRELSYAYIGEDGHLEADDGTVAAPSDGGSLSLMVLSNSDVTVTAPDGIPDWMHIEGSMSFTGDGTLKATMELNEGFRRGVKLVATIDGKEPLTITIRQQGVVPEVSCESPYKAIKGSVGSDAQYEVSTNIPEADIRTDIEYGTEGESWLSNPSLTEGAFRVSAVANSDDHSRKAKITLSFTDGWDVTHRQDLYLTQGSSTDSFGTPTDFQSLRAIATEAGTVPDPDLTVYGIAVSDCGSANMEENPVLTLDEAGDFSNTNVSKSTRESVMQVVDTTASARTAYFESADGNLGFRLVFDKAEENAVSFGDGITLSMEGTLLVKETSPERYTIYGVSASNIIGSLPDMAVPVKEKSLSTLTDNDVYTFVTLKDVEFPVKEGSYTDIRENHALWSEVNDNTVSATDSKRYFYMDSYASTLMDNEGKLICAPINILCRWRKPQDGIPQGNGNASGILVHNEILRYGDAGKYQLRVIDETGFEKLAANASAWKIIAGWDIGKTSASYGNGNITCTKPEATIADEHSYKSRTAATERTCGISDTYRSIRITSPVSGWYNWGVSDEVESFNGLCMNISTEGLQGSLVSVAFRFYAGRSGTASTFQAFPAHWCVDWSVDGGETWRAASNALDSGKQYVHLRSIATYTLQYGSYKIPTTTRSGIGASEHVFTLPQESLGQKNLIVRIRPYDTVLSCIPTLFNAETETSTVSAYTDIQDYVSFQDIFIRYR